MGKGDDGDDVNKEEEKNGTGGGGEGEDDEGNGKANKQGKQQQKKKKEEDGGGEGKKKASAGVLVLRVDLHCDGCARKVVKAIRAAQGVEGVAADVAGGTVTVTGKGADPWDLKDRIESKTHRPVAFVNPRPPKKKGNDDGAADGKKLPAGDNMAKSKTGGDKKKDKEAPPESTVVVKIGLHCNGCIDRIKRTAHKIKGVQQVTVDTAKEHVTVKGTMDAKALPDVLRRKLKRDVALVAPPATGQAKEGAGGGDKSKKKQQQEGDESAANKVAGEKQQQQGGGGGGKNKNKNKSKNNKEEDGGEEDAGGAAGQEEFPMAVMYGVGGGGPSASYRVEMLHAPQLFSDENPNACAVM